MTGLTRAVLTAFVLPPLLPLLLMALGLVLAATTRHRRKGLLLAAIALVTLWLLSCYAVSMALSRQLLVQYPTLTAQQVRESGAQAIVVLGGGILRSATEYDGAAPPNMFTAPRLFYGATLSKATGLPLAVTGGVGHGADTALAPEGQAMARFSERVLGAPVRWVDNEARDTAENGVYMAAILKREGIRRVALVTHGYHMERSVYAFERAGMEVVPAPTALLVQVEHTWVEWLPSATALQWSRLVLREWLGLQVARLH